MLATSTPSQGAELGEDQPIEFPAPVRQSHCSDPGEETYCFSIPLEGRPPQKSAVKSGSDSASPAHDEHVQARSSCYAGSRSRCVVEGDNLIVTFSERQLRQIAGVESGQMLIQWQCRPGIVADRIAISLAQRICEETGGGGIATQDCMDAWLTLLGAHILRTYSDLGRSGVRFSRAGGFSVRVADKIDAYIRQHLDEHLDLTRLAGVVNLSASHFTRAFRLRFGMAPHRYVIKLRVDRAWQLSAYSTLPLDTIARMTGFSNNSHMTATMRRDCGVTPSQVRRGEVRSDGMVATGQNPPVKELSKSGPQGPARSVPQIAVDRSEVAPVVWSGRIRRAGLSYFAHAD